jgi:hypothetical protein
MGIATSQAGTPQEVAEYELKTVLTDAEIKALQTTSIQLVPAQGAGKALFFKGAIFRKKFTAGSYGTFTDGDVLYIRYADPASRQLDAGFVQDNANGVSALEDFFWTTGEKYFDPIKQNLQGTNKLQQPSVIADAMEFENKALELKAIIANGDLTGGNAANTLEVTVYYSIVDL